MKSQKYQRTEHEDVGYGNPTYYIKKHSIPTPKIRISRMQSAPTEHEIKDAQRTLMLFKLRFGLYGMK
jgi:hypothetical protein